MIHIVSGSNAPYALMTQADLNALAVAGQSQHTSELIPTDQPVTAEKRFTAHMRDALASTRTVVTSWTATATAMRRFQFFIGPTYCVVVRCEGGHQYSRTDDEISVWRLEACEVPSAFLACSELRQRGADLPFPVTVPSPLMAALDSADLPTIRAEMRSFAQAMGECTTELGDEASHQFANDILADEWAIQSIVFDASARDGAAGVSSLFLLSTTHALCALISDNEFDAMYPDMAPLDLPRRPFDKHSHVVACAMRPMLVWTSIAKKLVV